MASDGLDSDRADRPFGQWWDWHGEFAQASVESLSVFGVAAYEAAGAEHEDAKFLFEGHLEKTLQGDHARGVGHLPGAVRAALAGEIDLSASIAVVRQRGATAVVDGGPRASGELVCRAAVDLAIVSSARHGVGVVVARGRAGSLGAYIKRATHAGKIGIAFAQSLPLVAPLGSNRPMLGNAPFAVGVPAAANPAVVADLAFTETSAGGVFLAALQGEAIPSGLILDHTGAPSTEPKDFFGEAGASKASHGLQSYQASGSLVPLGGHKGYAMIFVWGLLSSLLSDTGPAWELDEPGRTGKYGAVFIVLDPAAFVDGDVKLAVDAFIAALKAAPLLPGSSEILYPGERSQQLQQAARERGEVRIPRPHADALNELADELALTAPVGNAK